MTTYDDSLLTARFAALAPEPLAGNWDDVLRRSDVAQESPWRLGRLVAFRGQRRRRLLVLAAAALVVVVATASALAVRAFIVDRGFVGVPPEGATRSSPEKGELVVAWSGRSVTLPELPRPDGSPPAPCSVGPCGGPPIVRAWVYADGRIIWSRNESSIPEGANEMTSGYLEQRLTPEGVELVRSAVSGLFDRSRALLHTAEALYPGVGPLDGPGLLPPRDYPSTWGLVEVPDGDRVVYLSWGSQVHNPEGTIATPEQLSALRRVDALLTDPASVLPPRAWAVRKIRAYVPSHYAVCIETPPPKDASDVLSLLPARAEELLRGKGSTSSEGYLVGRYCSKLTTEEAREVADALSGLEKDTRRQGVVLAYQLAEAVDTLNPTTIWFEPYFPHGHFTISDSG